MRRMRERDRVRAARVARADMVVAGLGYGDGMSEERTVVAMVGNPVSGKGRGAATYERVLDLMIEAGVRRGFDVIDLTGSSFDDSLRRAREEADRYSHLVVAGGDGMISLGANAVGCSGKPLGIVAIGSGNDFARGLGLPVNRIETAVEGIVGAIVHGSHIDVDMGRVTSLPGGDGEPIDRFYGGMLNCGLDATINDRANHSHLPGGSLRYFVAVLVEVTRLKRYGYHIKATLVDGSVEEYDLYTPMITVANSRHVGGGLEISPYSRFDDGLLDLVWIDHMPNPIEIADAISKGYNGRLLASRVFGWKRVRGVEITRADGGAEPPVLMSDGEYVGSLPVRVETQGRALRVLVPPAVAAEHRADDGSRTMAALERDHRDPVTGVFV